MGKFDLKSLQQRTFSALVMVPIVLLAVVWGGWPFFIMIAVLACICVHEWLDMARKTDKFYGFSVIGFLYIVIGFLCCALIREDHSFTAAVLFLVMVWAGDIGAYFSGKVIGGPKMAPSISPNKTWAGLCGACVFAGVLGVLTFIALVLYNPEGIFSTPAILAVFILGVLIGIVEQGGDLFVSKMKRKTGVKDTGTLIPGHGGMLDRVDGMLLAAPFFYFVFDYLPLDF